MGHGPPPTDLPIESVIDQVRTALASHGLGVLTAEPGAGKTTIVPLRLLAEPWLDGQRILLLEPRRVAARAVARRMANLLGEPVGQTIGWRTRDDHRVSAATRIEVVTEGILTRRLQRDPSLPGVGAILFDEFHERSVHADLGLALTLDARDTIREDLRLLVMSATIDAPAVATLIGGADQPAPTIDCEGRSHPIEVHWQPRQRRDRLEAAVVRAVGTALEHPGDVLVFLPGVGEIKRTVDALHHNVDVPIRPLYGALSAEEQDEALRKTEGQRRVVVATDVAETSLTVDGIGTVVDAGLARRPRYDPATGLTRLVTISNSKASAEQRAGRAGRLGPGVAIRLWSKIEHAARPRHDQPEILGIDMAPLLLESLAWGVPDPTTLRLLDPPSATAIDEGRDVLAMLGALDADGNLTSLGREMLALPLHPRLAAMVTGAGDGPLGWPAAVLAALLDERDVIGGRTSERPVDLWTRVQLVVDRELRVSNADGSAIQTVRRRAHQLLKRTGARETTIHLGDLGRTLALAYPDRLAQKRRGQGGRFRLRNGMGGEIDRTDPMAHEEMLVVAELSGPKRNVRVVKAAAIDRLDVELGFAADVAERTFFGWDERANDLSMRVERRLGALDFGTNEIPISSSPDVTAALIDRIVATGLDLLTWTSAARNLQARVALIQNHRPDTMAIGDDAIDDASLLEAATEVFGPWLDSATGRADVEALDVELLLRTRLGWERRQIVDRLAPTELSLPKGRPAAIDYTAESPRISVRAQRLYGITTTPSIIEGSVPLTVELLSPADRPIQVTADLAAFWSGSWSEVRKEMAGRYPKHQWPDDPAGATPR